MRLIVNKSTSAYFNLACEEYLADRYDEDMFMVWTSVPSILIGKNQNTYAEINVPYVEENSVPVVRRMSGGGTIFCDRGNMNFTFIESDRSGFTDFNRFTKPILGYLRALGAPAEFSGRNDLVIDGKKFSGNAQYKTQKSIVHHGSLLFDASLSDLSKALTPNKLKFKDKSVKSVASRVTNISEHVEDKTLTVEGFREGLYEYVKNNMDNAVYYELTEEDIIGIEALVKDKYNTWQWNFGKSPKYSFVNRDKYKAGLVEVYVEVKNGFIKTLQVHGDFFSDHNLQDLSEKLIGVPYNLNGVEGALIGVNMDKYIKNMDKKAFCKLVCQTGDNE